MHTELPELTELTVHDCYAVHHSNVVCVSWHVRN